MDKAIRAFGKRGGFTEIHKYTYIYKYMKYRKAVSIEKAIGETKFSKQQDLED